MTKPEQHFDKIGSSKLITFALLWLILNAVLIGIGLVSFAFMIEKNNFYGKGSTGLIIAILFGMYKIHTNYFGYVITLKNKWKRKI